MRITSLAVLLCGCFCLAEPRTIVVSADGRGDFRTVQEAIAAVPERNTRLTVIRIRPGVYHGQIMVPRGKDRISFIGDDVESTVLTYNFNTNEENPAGVSRYFRGAGTVVLANDFRAEKITFRNTSGDHGQALALRIDADRAVVRDCRLLGWQDTLLLLRGRQYFTECYIEGRVDFIYGDGMAVFDRCHVHSKNGGYVTAASTPEGQPYGFVFLDCILTGSEAPWDPATANPPITEEKPRRPDRRTYLGRPWRPFGSVAFVNCWLGDHIRAGGWDNWGNAENERAARYAEYNSRGPGADPDMRVSWSRQLTDEEAKCYTISSILSGTDGWQPKQGQMGTP